MPFGRHPLKMVCLPISPLPRSTTIFRVFYAGMPEENNASPDDALFIVTCAVAGCNGGGTAVVHSLKPSDKVARLQGLGSRS